MSRPDPAKPDPGREDPVLSLGGFVHRLDWNGIPADAQRQAARAFRDTVGTILGGRSTKAGRIASRTVDAQGHAASLNAFALAVHASALDFDDGHYAGGAIHPGSVVVSALLAEMQRTRVPVSLRSALCAQVAGYEIALRAARLVWPRGEHDRYHCTGTAATLGAAAAVAKLRGCESETIARAIAIAWAHAPMSTFQLPMVKESIGWSAATAVFAVDLAEQGFMRAGRERRSPLDETFLPTPFHGAEAATDPFVMSLGSVFESANTYFKPYASCRYTHTALRSVQELVREHAIAAGDVKSIDVFTHRGAKDLRETKPATLEDAQYSFPFVIGALLVRGAADASVICESNLEDSAILAVAENVQVHHDPSLDQHYPSHYATRVEMECRGGRRFAMERRFAPGDVAEPLSDQELADKFLALAVPECGAAAAALAERLCDDATPDVHGLLASVGFA